MNFIQVPIDQFIVNLYCHELKLVIEVDGPVHEMPDNKKEDMIRQANLESLGVHFLRFRHDEIWENPGEVISVIKQLINSNGNVEQHPPFPSFEGGNL
ncbi:MAG: DUF559 domain-containing protein [Calditrichaeota bacterium]|nr:DUF559 domain-containing protein [Calditrichota bacterium]RQW04848.1 MAG: DUF559 domain-containing protein [Calditrichota bacterium]